MRVAGVHAPCKRTLRLAEANDVLFCHQFWRVQKFAEPPRSPRHRARVGPDALDVLSLTTVLRGRFGNVVAGDCFEWLHASKPSRI